MRAHTLAQFVVQLDYNLSFTNDQALTDLAW
eukprot:COSAG01_NODE_58276_length_307_cov_0.644231_1_plen_30_part_01